MVVVESRGATILGVGLTFLCINILAISLRCYTRKNISKIFNYNDVFMIACLAVYTTLAVLLVLGVDHGIGGHTVGTELSDIGECLKYVWCLEIIYVLLTSIMKASIAITLMQWAKSQLHIYILWGIIVIDVVICLVVSFWTIFQCSPVSYAWLWVNPDIHGTCKPSSDHAKVGYALCGTTVGLDMLLLILPVLMLRGRQISSRLRNYIFGLLALGVLASVANFIRLASLVKLSTSFDPLYDAADVFNWSIVEVSIGIIVAGLVELRPLMQKYNVKGFEKSDSSFSQISEETESTKLRDMSKSSEHVTMQDLGAQEEGQPRHFR